MNRIYLIFGCHSHQPVGNFDFVFERAYREAYLPFLDVLERYPAVRVTQHFTGPLLDWFEAHQPVFLERLAAMVEKGQIEIMGGGHYEPLLCAIPQRDSLAQIARMAEFCRKHFGQAPRGMWLAERVWEPHMPRIMSQAGIEYTALDDTHFLCSGLRPEELFGYYMTEDEGHCVKVFPISKKLRYLIPFHQVSESIDYLRECAEAEPNRCAVIHDDGEKFGVWPGTHNSVYNEGWLEAFFEALTENAEWIHSVTYSQYMDQAQALGRTYITCASYEEMMEWALPTAMQHRMDAVLEQVDRIPALAGEARQFIRGGFWRNFLAKYAESNNVQKRMLRVSGRLDALRGTGDARLAEAEKLLHQGQCNCAYWHGVFGGLYLNHLRTAVYECLIASERVMDSIEHEDDGWVNCESVDFDADGNDELVLENSRLSLILSPTDGGTLFEWDYKDKPFNFGNTLTRREEPYHEKLRAGAALVGEETGGDHSIHELVRAKEKGLERYLVYDTYRRVSMRDHFLPGNITATRLWAGTYPEMGDFAVAQYAWSKTDRSVTLTRQGVVSADGKQRALEIAKTVSLEPRASVFEIQYDILSRAEAPFSVLFGVEFAVNMLSGSSFDRYYRSDDRDMNYTKLGVSGCDAGLTHLALRDDWQRLECGFRFAEPATVYRFAIETVSQSEAGQE
ncbi:MAG: 4-alpha-glucanotransferase, partial [Candidatus Hydrogenedentes bacterium]|nr:4-alpha-glucanotransferase [Candidatus Hydrogenedentota bacterium]